jgi:hypothetical protein
MIKRITSNGTYLTMLSFILTTITYLTQSLTIGKNPDGELLMLLLVVAFVMILVLDYLVLKKRKFIHISKIEIIIFSALLITLFVNTCIEQIPTSLILYISLIHYGYRIINYKKIEDLNLQLKYEDIRKVLSLENECIAVKGDLKNYITYIRGKEISFDTEHSLMYKKKRIHFDIIKQLQIDFNKTFINFDDDELKVAEMYSIQ